MSTLFQEMTLKYNAEYKADPGIGQQPINKYLPDNLKRLIECAWGDGSDRAALVDIFMHGYFYGVNETKERFGVEDDD